MHPGILSKAVMIPTHVDFTIETEQDPASAVRFLKHTAPASFDERKAFPDQRLAEFAAIEIRVYGVSRTQRMCCGVSTVRKYNA